MSSLTFDAVCISDDNAMARRHSMRARKRRFQRESQAACREWPALWPSRSLRTPGPKRRNDYAESWPAWGTLPVRGSRRS
jgi:hypothetical protein